MEINNNSTRHPVHTARIAVKAITKIESLGLVLSLPSETGRGRFALCRLALVASAAVIKKPRLELLIHHGSARCHTSKNEALASVAVEVYRDVSRNSELRFDRTRRGFY